MSYVAGWDGGGSKTAVLCLDSDSSEILSRRFGPLNLNGLGESEIASTVKAALAAMGALTGGLSACQALVVGAAGISNPSAMALLERLIRQGGYTGALRIMGDHEILLLGAVGECGAVLIAGTGSICIGRSAAGALRRAGGLGYLIGDEGSGYWIGREMLAAAAKALDGRAPQTALTSSVLQALGCRDLKELMATAYGGALDKAGIASLAELLGPLAQQKDAAALSIARAASRELSRLAEAVIAPLMLDSGSLALAGGLLSEGSLLRSMTERSLTKRFPALHLLSPVRDAVHGAALAALKL